MANSELAHEALADQIAAGDFPKGDFLPPDIAAVIQIPPGYGTAKAEARQALEHLAPHLGTPPDRVCAKIADACGSSATIREIGVRLHREGRGAKAGSWGYFITVFADEAARGVA